MKFPFPGANLTFFIAPLGASNALLRERENRHKHREKHIKTRDQPLFGSGEGKRGGMQLGELGREGRKEGKREGGVEKEAEGD